MSPQTLNSDEVLKEQLSKLPRVVREAISSSDIEDRLRKLADAHKLHLDQWQVLENEVMMTLLGFKRIEDLQTNIKNSVGISEDVAHNLAGSVNTIVFEPIRKELERQLEHPEAQPEQETFSEAARAQALDEAHAEAMTAVPAVQPATPPAPTPDVKIPRPTEASAYKPGEPSHARASVHDDPYREPPA